MNFKINDQSSEAFKKGVNFKKSNSQVKIDGKFTKFYLFGNLIARLDRTCGQLCIRDCGWQTKTTKERLNAILGALHCGRIYSNKKQWYYETNNLNAYKFDGFQEIDVNFNF